MATHQEDLKVEQTRVQELQRAEAEAVANVTISVLFETNVRV